jgi:hypothetical protein
MDWYEGIAENYHLGRVARNAGKNRARRFEEALKVAILEMGKPIELRMDWNHPDPTIPSVPMSPARPKRSREEREEKESRKRTKLQFSDEEVLSKKGKACIRRNLEKTIAAYNGSARSEDIDKELFCRILLLTSDGKKKDLGSIKLPSRLESTFADARQILAKELENVPADFQFKLPSMGVVGRKSEDSIGPIFEFMVQNSDDLTLGDGSSVFPLKLAIVSSKSRV